MTVAYNNKSSFFFLSLYKMHEYFRYTKRDHTNNVIKSVGVIALFINNCQLRHWRLSRTSRVERS
jgi:hypothetical protein